MAFRTSAIKLFSGPAVVSTPGGKQSGAKLVIETAALIPATSCHPERSEGQQPVVIQSEAKDSNQQPSTSKLSPLGKIRQQYQTNDNNGLQNTNHPLQQEELQKAWDDYIRQLKEAKNPAAQSFELALLRVKDQNCFEALTANNIEQKFIEQERNKLFTFLQERLGNRLLQFNVIIEEKPGDRPKIEISLSAKEQFQKMIEQYPLVKDLKDRLRLELDY